MHQCDGVFHSFISFFFFSVFIRNSVFDRKMQSDKHICHWWNKKKWMGKGTWNHSYEMWWLDRSHVNISAKWTKPTKKNELCPFRIALFFIHLSRSIHTLSHSVLNHTKFFSNHSTALSHFDTEQYKPRQTLECRHDSEEISVKTTK